MFLLSSPALMVIKMNQNLSKNKSKDQELDKLLVEYDNLYKEAIILKEHPESIEYQQNKRLRQINIDRQIELAGG